jgi:protein-S-isoprenylcysteine O-methyltransferase Ste14
VVLPVFGGWLFWCLLVNRQKFKSAENISKLIITGPYGIVRHPIYLADLLGLFYLFLIYPRLWTIIGWNLGLAIVIWWAKKEEAALYVRFGQVYKDYASRTARFIPYTLKKALPGLLCMI